MLWFQHPTILFFLPLAAIPLLLHLFSRDLPPKLSFPPMRFLMQSALPQQGRRRWQDWALMLSRMALIAMLCLALAGPRWVPRTPESDNAQAEPPAMAIVLDSSASMLPLRAEAREAAAQLLDDFPGWECALFAFDQTAHQLAPAALDDWQPGYQAGSPSSAIRAAVQWLETRGKAARRRLVIISDFQRSNWNEPPSGVPNDIALLLCQAGKERPADNVSLTSVQTTPIGENRLRIRVGWRNWSERPQERSLRITLGSQTLTQTIALPPHTEGATAFANEFSLQDSRGVAALEPSDGWPADDRRFFWAQPEPPAPVLLLLPDGAADGALADELEFFFERALTSERDGAPPHFQTHPLGASALPLVDLQNFALVILAGGAERLPEEAAPLLQAYRAAGRSIIFLPGNAPVAAWRFLQNAGLLTASEQGLLRHSTGIGPLPETSPFTRIFPPTTPSDLHLFPIRQVLRVSPAPNDLVLLRTLDGHPALLQHHDDNPGSLYAFTFAFQQANTDFPLTQSFLPILRELCTEATCAHSATLRLNCGDIFPETHALNGALLPLPPDLTTLQPGLTRLGNHPVEINPPAVESIPEATDLSDLQRVLRAIPSAPLGAPPETASRLPAGARNLQRWCFAALAILAVLELLLMLCGVPVSRKTERHFFHTLWH